jgi:hypothetical protein
MENIISITCLKVNFTNSRGTWLKEKVRWVIRHILQHPHGDWRLEPILLNLRKDLWGKKINVDASLI